MRNSQTLNLIAYSLLSVLAFLQLAPLVILLFISVKSIGQLGTNPLLPTFPIHLDNYVRAWRIGIRYGIVNSLTITVSRHTYSPATTSLARLSCSA